MDGSALIDEDQIGVLLQTKPNFQPEILVFVLELAHS
jgi:hypothetical protein